MSKTDNASVPLTCTAVPTEDQTEHPGHGYDDLPPAYGAPLTQGCQPPACAQGHVVVIQPGQHVANANAEPAPESCMSAAIFVTLCCFCPTGLVAIMLASEVRSALARGDVARAKSHAKGVKIMVIISIIIGLICSVVLFFMRPKAARE